MLRISRLSHSAHSISLVNSRRCRPFFSGLFSSKAESNPANGSPNPAANASTSSDTTDKEKTAEVSLEGLQSKINELETKNKELKDHYLRALADAENLRERTRREKELAQQLAIKSFAVDLLSVSDILDIALNSVPEEKRNDESNPDLKNLYTGLSMTHKEMLAAFKRHGLQCFDPVGQPFDANMHQAMFQAPMEGKQPGTVFTVTKKGYLLNGIVVRAAQVGVVQGQ